MPSYDRCPSHRAQDVNPGGRRAHDETTLKAFHSTKEEKPSARYKTASILHEDLKNQAPVFHSTKELKRCALEHNRSILHEDLNNEAPLLLSNTVSKLRTIESENFHAVVEGSILQMKFHSTKEVKRHALQETESIVHEDLNNQAPVPFYKRSKALRLAAKQILYCTSSILQKKFHTAKEVKRYALQQERVYTARGSRQSSCRIAQRHLCIAIDNCFISRNSRISTQSLRVPFYKRSRTQWLAEYRVSPL
ncbi:hypothetical protein M513_06884 [Trichuris suis]|uniref:Uncharacterized protein n=1 Tax=Trichuris suis TaxID=68888 RepID=A0A085M525_9BILA|nr:hypothetical protein M513_06884 [Trichuris suis]